MILPGIDNIKQNKPIIILDDVNKEQCAYLVCPAENISKEMVVSLINYSKGIIFVALSEDLANEKGLSPLSTHHPKGMQVITVSIESRKNVTSGISAMDRAYSIRALASSNIGAKEIVAPGHIFPVIGKNSGLLVRTHIADAIVDIMKICSLPHIGAYAHILSDNGEIAQYEEISNLAHELNLPIVKTSSIITYRLQHESLVEKVCTTKIPTSDFGNFDAHCFISKHDGGEHLALSQGDISSEEPILVRMHSEEKVGDIFSFKSSLQREKLTASLNQIHLQGRGVFVYIKKAQKNTISKGLMQASSESNQSINTHLTELGVGAQILRQLNISKLRLLTSNTKFLGDLSAFNLEVVEQIPLSLFEKDKAA